MNFKDLPNFDLEFYEDEDENFSAEFRNFMQELEDDEEFFITEDF